MKTKFRSYFSPNLMDPQILETLFVKREELAQRISGLLTDSVLTKSKHHNLLIGPRGIGKTHFVSLIYHRLKADPQLQHRAIIAWLRKEEWGINSFFDLLMRILRALLAQENNPKMAQYVFQGSRLNFLHNLLIIKAQNCVKTITSLKRILSQIVYRF